MPTKRTVNRDTALFYVSLVSKKVAIVATVAIIALSVILLPVIADPLALCPPGAYCAASQSAYVSVTYFAIGIGGISGGATYALVYTPWTCSAPLHLPNGVTEIPCHLGQFRVPL